MTSFRPDTTVVLRHSDGPLRLEELRSRTNIGTGAFERSAPRLFNKLPLDIKQSATCDIFKRKLKAHIFVNCYKSGEINPSYSNPSKSLKFHIPLHLNNQFKTPPRDLPDLLAFSLLLPNDIFPNLPFIPSLLSNLYLPTIIFIIVFFFPS